MNKKLGWLLMLVVSGTAYGSVTITTPTVNTGELIRAGDWNKIRADLLSLSSTIDILGGAWEESGGDIYFLDGKVGIGLAAPTAQLNVYKETPAANEKMFQIGTGVDADKFTIDEDGDMTADGTLLLRGGTVYDSSGSLELHGEDNVYVGIDWNNNDVDNRAFVIGKNAAGPGTNWSEIMRVQENGKVGIGTSSPGRALSIGNGNAVQISSSGDVATEADILLDTQGTLAAESNLFLNSDANGTGAGDIYFKSGAETTAATTNVTIKNTGNVGIGTETPSANLEIVTSSGNSEINLVGGTTSAEGVISFGDANVRSQIRGGYGVGGGGDITFMTDTSEGTPVDRMIIDNAGNVGIGTTNPEALLEISGTEKPSIIFDDDQGSSQRWEIGEGISTNTGELSFKELADDSQGSNVVFDITGNVGIGTTNPGVKLHIESDVTAAASTPAVFLRPGTPNNGYNDIQIGKGGTGEVGVLRYKNATAGNSFEVFHYGDSYGLAIAEGGNVGIGMTTPASELDVAGTIRAEQICDETGSNCQDISSGWAASGGSGSGGSGGASGSSMIDGWPDVIECTNGASTRESWLYLTHSPFTDGKYWYENLNNANYLQFNADKSYSGNTNMSGWDCNSKSIAQLETEGLIHNFGGGSGGGSGTSPWTEIGGNVTRSSGNVGVGTTTPTAKLEVNGAIKHDRTLLNAARGICYSALPAGNVTKSVIMVPLPSNTSNLDSVCHSAINTSWNAGGVAKPNYLNQDCGSVELENSSYGGGYTSYVLESYFEANSGLFPNCNVTNSMVCCSPQFPN